MAKYYIANGDKYVSNITDDDFSYVQGHVGGVKRYKYTDVKELLESRFSDKPEWTMQKLFDSKSGKRYVITNATEFVMKEGRTTDKFEYAKAFRSPADAEAYINNHADVKNKFVVPVIIDDEFNTVEMSAHKTFTKEQLIALGKYSGRTERRIVFKKETRKLVYERDGGVCQLCGRPIPYESFTIDHIEPLGRGGKNDMSNLRCVCEVCNKIKMDLRDKELTNSLTNVLGYEMFKNPDTEITNKLIRCIVRGSIKKSV